VIEEIVPPTVAAVEAFDHPRRPTRYPEEEPVIAREVDKRRREFTTPGSATVPRWSRWACRPR
jgi:hypothetical protein